jgi:hypothetical protein
MLAMVLAGIAVRVVHFGRSTSDAISCSGGNSTAAAPSLAPEKATFVTSLHAARNQKEVQLGAPQPWSTKGGGRQRLSC